MLAQLVLINVVQKLICLDIITTVVIFTFIFCISLKTWKRLVSVTRNRITLVRGFLSLPMDRAFDYDIRITHS